MSIRRSEAAIRLGDSSPEFRDAVEATYQTMSGCLDSRSIYEALANGFAAYDRALRAENEWLKKRVAQLGGQ